MAADPVGVAAAVPALVARADDGEHLAQRGDRREDGLAGDRVAAHDPPLGVVERAGLVQDRLRDADLPDVVEERAELEQVELLRPEPERPADVERERDDLLRVVVRVGVLLLERVRERRERLAVQTLHRLGVLDLGEQPAGLAGEEVGERDLVLVEATAAEVVDLDQAPDLAAGPATRA